MDGLYIESLLLMPIRSAIPAGRDLNEKLLALLGDDAVILAIARFLYR